MKDFFAIANVTYFDVGDMKGNPETIVITEVSSFQDAMSRIEDYYSTDLESVQLELYEGPFITLSKRYAEMLAAGKLEEE